MENNFNQIERFFTGVMNRSEIDEFEARKLTDADFANEVALYQKAREVITAGARHRMMKQLIELGRNDTTILMNKPFVRFPLMRKYLAIAASIIVLLGLSYFAFYSIQSQRPESTLADLYSSYYITPEVDRVILRGQEEEGIVEVNWNLAMQKYSSQQYADALSDINLLLADSAFTYTSTAHFYAGICYLNLSLPDSAASQFGKVSASSSFTQDATWFIGMSYLKAGDTIRASKIFDEISGSEHYKRKEAKEISKSLRRKMREEKKAGNGNTQ